MRISIWQQFSSNHSGSFNLVGTFTTPQEAQNVYTELYEFFEKYWQWWLTLGQNALERNHVFRDKYEEERLSPVQLEFMKKYKLKTDYVLEWIIRAESKSEFTYKLNDMLTCFENHIFLKSPLEISLDYGFFAEYLGKREAKLAVTGEIVSTGIRLTILIKSPIPEKVERLVNSFLEKDAITIWESTWIFKDVETYLQEGYWHIDKIFVSMLHGSKRLKESLQATIKYFENQGCTIEYRFYAE